MSCSRWQRRRWSRLCFRVPEVSSGSAPGQSRPPSADHVQRLHGLLHQPARLHCVLARPLPTVLAPGAWGQEALSPVQGHCDTQRPEKDLPLISDLTFGISRELLRRITQPLWKSKTNFIMGKISILCLSLDKIIQTRKLPIYLTKINQWSVIFLSVMRTAKSMWISVSFTISKCKF